MTAADAQRLASLSDMLVARLARPGPLASDAPEAGQPRDIGSVERARQLLSGRCRIGGILLEAVGPAPWDAVAGVPSALRALHGFDWLTDLAALPTPEAEAVARAWTTDWLARFGGGRGPGWAPDLAGRRALRLVQHAGVLRSVAVAPALARHVAFLSRRAATAGAGLPRLEALTGLVHAGIALDPRSPRVVGWLAQLDAAAHETVDRDGAVASRSPEALGRVLSLLAWSAEAMLAHGLAPGAGLTDAMKRAAPVLRALVQPDGRLPRFHGGGGAQGMADAALSLTGWRDRTVPARLAMGFARVRHGRASLILDAAPPPVASNPAAHASTLALELTLGDQPFIANPGPAERYGARWERSARTTAAHSTLVVDGFSSSRFASDADRLRDVPRVFGLFRDETDSGTRLGAAHDGYVASHGLVHERAVELARDGRRLVGEDLLVASEPGRVRRFEKTRRRGGPVRFAIRFHLSRSVEPTVDPSSRAVSLTLPSGAIWTFRVTAGDARIALEPAATFPADALEPVPSRQIAVFSSAREYATRIAWEFARVPEDVAISTKSEV